VTVYVTAPLGEEVAEDWPKLIGMNAGIEIGDYPLSDGAQAI
jgi:hypothetical protein